MPKYTKLETDANVSLATPPEGAISLYYTELNGKVVPKAKKSNGEIVKLSSTSNDKVVSSINGATGDVIISNVDVSLTDPGEYTAFLVTAGSTPIVNGMPDAMTHAFQLMCARLAVGVSYQDYYSVGTYDVVVDWGDGTVTSPSDLTFISPLGEVAYNNTIYWSNGNSSYGYTYTDQTLMINYEHRYATPGVYKVKILGTTYYNSRNTVSYHRSRNLVSRCLLADLPLFRGFKRLQGTFAYAPQLKKINCPSYYRWPDELIDCTSMLDSCASLVSLGDMRLPETVRSTSCLVKGCSSLLKGIMIPDRTTNTSQMYSECINLEYIPNIGKSVQNMYNFAMKCNSLKAVDGIIPATTKYAKGAFCQTFNLKHAPEIDPATVFGWADDLDLTTLDGETYYNLSSNASTKHEAIRQLFDCSGIITAPSTLGSVEGSNMSAYKLFADCKNLKYTPVIPLGIVDCTNLCEGCYSLELCGIKENKTLAYNVSGVLPSTVTNMSYAFQDCYNLKELPNIPAGVTDCSYMCNNCISLTNVSGQFNSNIALVDADYMFNGCRNLVVAPSRLPATVKTLNHAFSDCYNLVLASLGSYIAKMTELTDISYAFNNCYNLQTIYFAIPDSVTNAAYAFYSCYNAYSLPYFGVNSKCLSCQYVYYSARKMLNANIRLPKTAKNAKCFMTNSVLCKTALNYIVHSAFDNTGIDMHQAFNGCGNLSVTLAIVNVVAPRLWNDENASAKFLNTTTAFGGITADWINYIPSTWGGKLSV